VTTAAGLAIIMTMAWCGTTSAGRAVDLMQEQEPAVDRMTIVDFAVLQAKRGALVVDVRNSDSFTAGHIPGAINVPVDAVSKRVSDIATRAKGRPVVTYCSCINEHTSAIAAQTLIAAGVTRVSALVGGYPAWVAQGGTIERELVPIHAV
jgi:rhodanese-related sulfurtransferase